MPSTPPSEPTLLPSSLIDQVAARVAADKRVRRILSAGGLLSLDRRLPFLCVYRKSPGGLDLGTHQLITGEAAFLVAGDDVVSDPNLPVLVRRLAEIASDEFGSFLIVEIWTSPNDETSRRHSLIKEVLNPRPEFHVRTQGPKLPDKVVERLTLSLSNIKLHGQSAHVSLEPNGPPHPPALPPLLTAAEARRLNGHLIGIEVRPVYRNDETSDLYPRLLRTLRRALHRALKRTFYTFLHAATNVRPAHYHVLGPRTLHQSVWEVDRQLAEVSNTFDFLLQTTPVNADAAWHEFKKSGFAVEPQFYYRPLAVEPTLLKRRLHEVPLETVDDSTMAHLFHQKLDELDRKITMLSDVGTSKFLPGSLQVYGGVEPLLLELAHELLRVVPARSRDDSIGEPLSAHEFADRATVEIGHYRDLHPDFTAQVVVRDDMYAGLMVSQGDLFIGRNMVVPDTRVEPLLQHEIGTHSLTWYNGRMQPLQLLHAGLAGYEGFQEGLAVLAEYLAGGLSRPRVRLLAGRVVATHLLVERRSFIETFRELHETFRFSRRTAYTITMRVYRGGGLTKDAVYLRGLVEVLHYLRKGRALEPLFLGKMAAEHVPIVEELLHRNILRPPPLRPLYLQHPGVPERLERLAGGLSVLQLLEGTSDADRIRRQRRADRTGRIHHDPAGHVGPDHGP